MAGRPPVPEPTADDDEDVSWALSTAAALFSRGEASESLKWLRRAAETASDANRDERAVELFKAAADMAGEVERSKSQMPPSPSVAPPPRASSLPPVPPSRASSLPPGQGEGSSPSRRPPPPPPPAPPRKGSAVPPPPITPQPSRPPAPPVPGRPTPAETARKPPVIVAPSVASQAESNRTRRAIESDRATIAGVGHDTGSKPAREPTPALAAPRRARTTMRTKGLMSLNAQKAGRDKTPAPSPPPRESAEQVRPSKTKEPEPSAVRAKREDEITAVRDFSAIRAAKGGERAAPAASPSDVGTAPNIAAFAASFDDEQTHVLAGEESFVDLGSTRDDKKPRTSDEEPARAVSEPIRDDDKPVGDRATVILEPTPALRSKSQREPTPPIRPRPKSDPAPSLASASVTAFRVAVVADGTNVQILALREGEYRNGDTPTAFIVPSDAASSEAIRRLLSRGDGK